jgi:hypothetical protein
MSFEADQVRSLGGGTRLRLPPRLLVVVALAGAALLVVAFAPPEAQASAARLAIVAAGAVAAWRVLGRSAAVTASSPERFELDLRKPIAAPVEIAGLRSIETDLRMAEASAFGLEFRLKPLLRELATWRLARNHGVDLAAAPEAARGILGDRLFELTRAVEELPEYRDPGIPLAEVHAGVERLEEI